MIKQTLVSVRQRPRWNGRRQSRLVRRLCREPLMNITHHPGRERELGKTNLHCGNFCLANYTNTVVALRMPQAWQTATDCGMRFFLNPTLIIFAPFLCSGKPLPAYNGSQAMSLRAKVENDAEWSSSQVMDVVPKLDVFKMLVQHNYENSTTQTSFVPASEVVGGWCVWIYSLLFIHLPLLYCNNWAGGIEPLQCSDTTKTRRICRSWTLEWPKLCNTKGPHSARAASSPREPLPAAQQIIGPADAAFPLQFCELYLCQPHQTLCQTYFCAISPKSILNTFPLCLFSGRYFKSWWWKVNGNALSTWVHAISLKTGFKSTRHPFYSKDAQRTEKNRDCERKHHKLVWFAHRAEHGLSAAGDQKSPEHQWLRVRSRHISTAFCSRAATVLRWRHSTDQPAHFTVCLQRLRTSLLILILFLGLFKWCFGLFSY